MNKIKSIAAGLVAGLAMLSLSPVNASATLIGDTVTLDSAAAGFTGATAVVGAGVEFNGPAMPVFTYSVDFQGPDGLTVVINALINSASVSGFDTVFLFTGLDIGADIVGVDIVSSEFLGFGAPSINFFTNNSFEFQTGNFGAVEAVGESLTAILQIQVQTQVAEPNALAVFGLGILGLGLVRRRRKS